MNGATTTGGARRRLAAVLALELDFQLKRPATWVLIILLALFAWGLSGGNVTIQSGDASVGGTKAWITSEFSTAFILAAMVSLLYAFFVAIFAGMSVLRDDDLKVGEVLHATPLKPGEYAWGKFLAVMAAFLVVLGLHLLFTIFFNHVLPNPEAVEIRGPLDPLNYLRPALVFVLPALLFFGGTAFWIGARWRRPLLIFLLPLAVVMLMGFILWNWAPTWLDPRINRLLMWLDPGGFRWLNETWLKLDRGVEFYNTSRIGLDLPFVLSRLAFAGVGLGCVALARRHLARALRGAAAAGGRRRKERIEVPAAGAATALPAGRPLADLAMATAPAGFFGHLREITRQETRLLLREPAFYLFAVVILVQTLGNATTARGAFQTDLLLTPGLLAVGSVNSLTTFLVLLLMFFTVEAIEREQSTGLAAISYTTPAGTGALLAGKALANSLVAVLVMLAAFVGCALVILIRGEVGLDVAPFLLVWGVLLTPTFLAWTTFVTAVRAITGERYFTYSLCLAAFGFTLYRQLTGKMNWVGNWMLWDTLRWSDMGTLQLNARALLLNRAFMLGLAVLFTVIAVRFFRRAEVDAQRVLHRLQPRALARGAAALMPWLAVPLVAGTVLWLQVADGFQGQHAEKKDKDYWKQNLATWNDAPRPALAAVDMALELEPGRRFFRARGTYRLRNDHPEPLARFALTGGRHWRQVSWTFDGEPYEPEDRTRLYVFHPEPALAPGETAEVGFEYEGFFPDGFTKNGGGTGEFILPAGVVLTSFTPSFAPVVGYMEQIGVDDENRYEPKVYPRDFYHAELPPAFGTGTPFTTRIEITAPEEYTANSVGTLTAERVADGRRTVVWESDHPVRFFNVVAGRWAVAEGEGTAIYHHPEHSYNIAAMLEALDASRRHYGEWFYPFPWRRLKLSEFPNLASYAQGFPTNITFSEGIGFLTESDVKTDAVFLVTAHEAAHQWWGNILTPGEGPGTNILAEGMSHFSTALLMEEVRGERARMEFLKRIEEQYGDNRRVDSERPLVEIDGSRPGDTTVTYDKGGWVMWMLAHHMGRETALAGLREFIERYQNGPDFPALQDLVDTLRPFAPDAESYDRFTAQWYFDVVVPEYRFHDAERRREGEGRWLVTARLENAGTGRVPVEVAAVAGERFLDDSGEADPDYREARATVTLGAGESADITLECDFEPERLLADPDVEVLQLQREAALARF